MWRMIIIRIITLDYFMQTEWDNGMISALWTIHGCFFGWHHSEQGYYLSGSNGSWLSHDYD